MGESATASTPGESFQGKGGALCHSQSSNQLEKKSMKLPNPADSQKPWPCSTQASESSSSACLRLSMSLHLNFMKQDYL